MIHVVKIGMITRSCGHKEDAGEVSTKYGEANARKWELQKKCKACIAIDKKVYSDKVKLIQTKAEAYIKKHDLNDDAHIINCDDKHAEIQIIIK